ncbi:serine/threonine protein kinase [Candidatus Riflebacteria bacterium]
MENLTCPHCQTPTPINFDEDGNIYCPSCRKNILGDDISIEESSRPILEAIPEIPNYVLKKQIGEGGMGKVFLGENADGESFAIKFLAEDLSDDPDYLMRFEREANVMESLIHPHIVRIFGRGKINYHYIIMEYLQGLNLRDYIRETQGNPPLPMVNLIIMQIAAGLCFAHKHNIIHRDIKPENIFLVGDSKSVKIMDFGLAGFIRKTSSQNLTATGAILGTFNYMAPEQRVQSKYVDFRADIYSLGVIFYEMLLSELPLGLIRLPSDVRPDLNPQYDEIILNCLAADPKERYENLDLFIDDLAPLTGIVGHEAANPFSSGKLTKAAPESLQEKEKKMDKLALCPFCAEESENPETCSNCGKVIDSDKRKADMLVKIEEQAARTKYDQAITLLQTYLKICDHEEKDEAFEKINLYKQKMAELEREASIKESMTSESEEARDEDAKMQMAPGDEGNKELLSIYEDVMIVEKEEEEVDYDPKKRLSSRLNKALYNILTIIMLLILSVYVLMKYDFLKKEKVNNAFKNALVQIREKLK